MIKKIIKLSIVASLSMAVYPALAQTTATPAAGSTPAAGGNVSNPGGLASSGSGDFKDAGGGGKKDYDYNNANKNATALANHFSQKLAAMQLAIIEAMRLSTGQLSGNLREQSGAGHTLADQEDDRSTVKSIEQARIEAIQRAVSGSTTCTAASGGRGGQISAHSEMAALINQEGWLKWLAGEAAASKNGQRVATLRRLEAHCEFASQGDVEAGLCSEVGKLPKGDVDAKASIFKRGDTGVVSTMTPDQMAASQLFVINSMAPYPVTPIDPRLAQTDEAKTRAAADITYKSRQSVATEYMADFLARRAPIKADAGDTAKKIAEWSQEVSSNMQGFEGSNFKRDGVSLHDWMKLMSKNVILNDVKMVSSDVDIAVAVKDIKNMMAVQNYMTFENYEMMERIGVILAQQLAIMNDQTRNDIIAAPGAQQ